MKIKRMLILCLILMPLFVFGQANNQNLIRVFFLTPQGHEPPRRGEIVLRHASRPKEYRDRFLVLCNNIFICKVMSLHGERYYFVPNGT